MVYATCLAGTIRSLTLQYLAHLTPGLWMLYAVCHTHTKAKTC